MDVDQALNTISRIAECWQDLNMSCDCPPKSACNICEIQYLLDEVDEEHGSDNPYPHWQYMSEAQKDEAVRKAY